MKFARLTERVAAGGRVNDEKNLVRRGRIVFGQGAFHFLELSHQIAFGVQTAGGVAEQKINLVVDRSLIRIVTKRSWIRAVLTLHHFNAEAIRPNSKLFDGGGPERIGGGEQHGMSMLFQIMRQFRDRSCLAGSIDASDENNVWLSRNRLKGFRFCRKDFRNLFAR